MRQPSTQASPPLLRVLPEALENANQTPRHAPSPCLGGGEKVAAGRMRGGATCADAHPSPQPSPLLRGRERGPALLATLCAALLLGCDASKPETKPGGHGHSHGEEAVTGASFKAGRGVTLTPETKQRLAVQVVDVTEEKLTRRVEFAAQAFAPGGRSEAGLRASGTVSAPTAALLRAGFPVQLQRHNSTPVPGIVRAIHPPLSGEVEMELDLPADAPFQAGDHLTVSYSVPREQVTKVIPRSALLRAPEGTFAYVVNGSAYLRTAVKVGVESVSKVEITDGLLAGDAVVTHGVEQLYLIELRAVKGGGHCH